MTFSSGVIGTMGALALLISLIALAVALSTRQRAMNSVPAPAALRPGPDPGQRHKEAVPAKPAATHETENAGGGEPMVKITPAPGNDQVAAVIAAAIAAYLSEEAGGEATAPVTHVTNYGVTGPVWKAAGRASVIGSRQSMYEKGYRR